MLVAIAKDASGAEKAIFSKTGEAPEEAKTRVLASHPDWKIVKNPVDPDDQKRFPEPIDDSLKPQTEQSISKKADLKTVSYDAYLLKTPDTQKILDRAVLASKNPRPTWDDLEKFLREFGLTPEQIEVQRAKVRRFYPNLFDSSKAPKPEVLKQE